MITWHTSLHDRMSKVLVDDFPANFKSPFIIYYSGYFELLVGACWGWNGLPGVSGSRWCLQTLSLAGSGCGWLALCAPPEPPLGPLGDYLPGKCESPSMILKTNRPRVLG